MFGNGFDAKFTVRILVNIPENIQYFRVAVIHIDEFKPVLYCGAVQVYHEFQKQDLPEQIRRISVVREGLLKL